MALDSSRLELWRVSGRAASGRQPRFALPRVFPPEARTHELYAELAGDVVASCVDGYHGSIFACAWRGRRPLPDGLAVTQNARPPCGPDGQTSTGKTFTMQGTQQDPGIIPLAVRDVFQRIRGRADREFLLRISYLEVYNESVNDLLNPDATNLKLVEDPLLGAPAARSPPHCLPRPTHASCSQAVWSKACARRWWPRRPRFFPTSASASLTATSAPPTTISSPPAPTPSSAWWWRAGPTTQATRACRCPPSPSSTSPAQSACASGWWRGSGGTCVARLPPHPPLVLPGNSPPPPPFWVPARSCSRAASSTAAC